MHITSTPRTLPELSDPPTPSPEALAVLHIARRARVSLNHAAVVAQLAGLGTFREEARR